MSSPASPLKGSRSEGSLTLAVDTAHSDFGNDTLSTLRTTDGMSSKRSKGITKEEALCFKRRLVPSASYEDKIETYWRHIGKSRTQLTASGANTMPNGKGVFWNGPQFKNTILSTEEEFNATNSSLHDSTATLTPGSVKSRRGGLAKGQKPVPVLNPLDREEEHLAHILKHLFPSTRAEMARVGSSYKRRGMTPGSRGSATVAFGLDDHRDRDRERGQQRPGDKGDMDKGQPSQGASSSNPHPRAPGGGLNKSGKSDGEGEGKHSSHSHSRTKDAGSPSKQKEKVQGGKLLPSAPSRLKPHEAPAPAPSANQHSHDKWHEKPGLGAHGSAFLVDTGVANNALNLIAGAANSGAVHRDLGGGAIAFTHGELPKHKHIRAATKAASSVSYLVAAMKDPNASAEDDRKKETLSRQSSKKIAFEEKIREKREEREEQERKRKQKDKGGAKAHETLQCEESTFSLREFRKRVLDRFNSVMEAFNSIDVDSSKKLSQKEWNLVLFQSGLANYREARMLFEVMDANKDGQLTMLEFHVGIESIAPVTTLEHLRKRLLCVGFTSTYQALIMMAGGAEETLNRPLIFPDFSDALRRVYISEPLEHRCIFEAVRSDPGSRMNDTRVSIGDLACALAAVSPCLLLEDLRSRLLKRFGSVGVAWQSISGSESAEHCTTKKIFGLRDFTKQTVDKLGFTPSEAAKAFNLIDIDGSMEISRAEFVGAMGVSTPSLIFEDVRYKVRQRYLSIDVAFRHAFETIEGDGGDEEEELDDTSQLEMEEFADILEKLEICRKDTIRLFKLIGSNDNTSVHSVNGKLTLFEFFKGVRLFAPSVMLEGIRLQLLANWPGQNQHTIADCLCSVGVDRRAHLDRNGLAAVLDKLKVQCDDYQIDLIFDFLDVRNAGVITLSEMIAALQNIQPGSRKQVDQFVLEERAEHSIKQELAPFHKTVTDLKRRVKQGLRDNTEDAKPHRKPDDEQHGRLPRIGQRRAKSMPAGHGSGEPGEGDGGRPEGRGLSSAGGPPRSASAQGPQSTYYKLHSRFKQLPVPENSFNTTMYQLKGYFNSAHSTMQDHRPVLENTFTRIELHRSTEDLMSALDPRLVEFRKASDAARL